MKDYSDKEYYETINRETREIKKYFITIKDNLDFVPTKEKLLEFTSLQRRSLYYMCENQIYDYVNGVEDVYINKEKKAIYDKMCERSHKLELLIEDIDCHNAYSYMFGEFNHVYTEDDFKGWTKDEAQDFITQLWACGFEYDALDDDLRYIPRRKEIENRISESYNNCIEIFRKMGYEVQ